MDTLPAIAPEADPAARAFGRLAEKVELLETAIAGLVARRDAAPDYNQTLGEQAARLNKMVEGINILARRPAMQITPGAMAAEIEAAGARARAADSATIAQARERIDAAANWIERLAGRVANIGEQRRRLLWAAGGGLFAGMLLWSFLPGAILRTMPQGWHMPEAMAAHIVGEPTLWEAGMRLLRADSAPAWNALSSAVVCYATSTTEMLLPIVRRHLNERSIRCDAPFALATRYRSSIVLIRDDLSRYHNVVSFG